MKISPAVRYCDAIKKHYCEDIKNNRPFNANLMLIALLGAENRFAKEGHKIKFTPMDFDNLMLTTKEIDNANKN